MKKIYLKSSDPNYLYYYETYFLPIGGQKDFAYHFQPDQKIDVIKSGDAVDIYMDGELIGYFVAAGKYFVRKSLHPDTGERMPCLIVYKETGFGKLKLIKYFTKKDRTGKDILIKIYGLEPLPMPKQLENRIIIKEKHYE